ncbi:hypothetical protein [Caballeronia sp. J97]|uniref:hypothetical protein n=1 Tax=Caballeronia sp. J97 TaxID=2805429 RepID=UPI002AB1C2CC|nr:hypothetical protein [Caballeronia sp. J97]
MNTVNVRIGRLVVDAPLRGEAAQWDEAIGRALAARLSGAGIARAHVPETIARHVAERLSESTSATRAAPHGVRHGRV